MIIFCLNKWMGIFTYTEYIMRIYTFYICIHQRLRPPSSHRAMVAHSKRYCTISNLGVFGSCAYKCLFMHTKVLIHIWTVCQKFLKRFRGCWAAIADQAARMYKLIWIFWRATSNSRKSLGFKLIEFERQCSHNTSGINFNGIDSSERERLNYSLSIIHFKSEGRLFTCSQQRSGIRIFRLKTGRTFEPSLKVCKELNILTFFIIIWKGIWIATYFLIITNKWHLR